MANNIAYVDLRNINFICGKTSLLGQTEGVSALLFFSENVTAKSIKFYQEMQKKIIQSYFTFAKHSPMKTLLHAGTRPLRFLPGNLNYVGCVTLSVPRPEQTPGAVVQRPTPSAAFRFGRLSVNGRCAEIIRRCHVRARR